MQLEPQDHLAQEFLFLLGMAEILQLASSTNFINVTMHLVHLSVPGGGIESLIRVFFG